MQQGSPLTQQRMASAQKPSIPAELQAETHNKWHLVVTDQLKLSISHLSGCQTAL